MWAAIVAPEERGPRRLVAPLIGVVVLLAGWELLSDAGIIQRFVLPAPTAVARAIGANWSMLLQNARDTIEEAALGFIIGNTLAIGFAVAVVSSRVIRRSVYPAALVARSVPLIALVPVLILWLGTGMSPRVFIAAASVFFPTMLNTVRGLGAVRPEADELFDTYSATRLQRLTKLRMPTSLPYLFAGLKIGAAHCFIGAIVAEWLSANAGLGNVIVVAGYEFQLPLLWAAVFVAAGLTLGSFGIVAAAERLALPWLPRGEGR